MQHQYSVRAQTGQLIELYTAQASAKYSEALSRMKKYKVDTYVFCDNTLEVITKAECEYVLK